MQSLLRTKATVKRVHLVRRKTEVRRPKLLLLLRAKLESRRSFATAGICRINGAVRR